jgi:HSP20 family protein
VKPAGFVKVVGRGRHVAAAARVAGVRFVCVVVPEWFVPSTVNSQQSDFPPQRKGDFSMSLIPFRTKRTNGMEPGSAATLADFRNEMNRLFEGFFSRPIPVSGWFDTIEPGQWLPAVDLREDGGQILVRAELPGIAPEDVNVSVSEDRLVISGEKKTHEETRGAGWTHRESHAGSFTRAIPLPEPVDPERVTARYDKGVLTVELTKSPASTSRKVPVLTS